MGKFIRRRERVVETDYYLRFDKKGEGGWLLTFDCDENGKVDTSKFTEITRERWEEAHTDAYHRPYVESSIRSWTEPGVIECGECGRHVSLPNFTNTCECGADYNMSGHRLADRSQWGCETGEHWTDCY